MRTVKKGRTSDKGRWTLTSDLQKALIVAYRLRHAAIGETIDPIVISNPDECRPRDALREYLGVPNGRPVVVVTHAGVRGEVQVLADEAGADTAIRLDLFDPARSSRWPSGSPERIT